MGRIGYKEVEQVRRQKILDSPLVELTEEEKVEDFNYLFKTIIENYPYLEVNKRMKGVDWEGNYDKYLEFVINSRTDKIFFERLESALWGLGNGHTHMMRKETVENFRESYKPIKEQGGWQGINYDILNHPFVLRRYGIEDKLEDGVDKEENTNAKVIKNAEVQDIIGGKVAYIKIPKMIQPWEMAYDKELVGGYLMKIKDYPVLIIDIRGNGGGNSSYWSEYLLPQIIDQPYSARQYLFYKDGEYNRKYFEANHIPQYKIPKVNNLETKKLTNLPDEILSDFTYYQTFQQVIRPTETSIQFKGNIYLLVDEVVYSSAEMLAMFVKESGLATLVGKKTGGDGIGSDPLLAMLPNSGYVFRFSKELGTTGDGTCNEEHKTIPDYIVENIKQTLEVENDECIQKVLEIEGLN